MKDSDKKLEYLAWQWEEEEREAEAEAKWKLLEIVVSAVCIILIIALCWWIGSSIQSCQNLRQEQTADSLAQFVVSQTQCEKDCRVEVWTSKESDSSKPGFYIDIKKGEDGSTIFQHIKEALIRGKHYGAAQTRLTYTEANGEKVVVNDMNGDFLPDTNPVKSS